MNNRKGKVRTTIYIHISYNIKYRTKLEKTLHWLKMLSRHTKMIDVHAVTGTEAFREIIVGPIVISLQEIS